MVSVNNKILFVKQLIKTELVLVVGMAMLFQGKLVLPQYLIKLARIRIQTVSITTIINAYNAQMVIIIVNSHKNAK
jgi:hypothetical protein